MGCQKFRSKRPSEYDNLLREHVSENASNAESFRTSRETLLKSGGAFRATVTWNYTPEELIDRYLTCVTAEKRNRLYFHFANAILNDGIEFTTGSRPNCNAFWKCAFGVSWKQPYHDRISVECLDKTYNERQGDVTEAL